MPALKNKFKFLIVDDSDDECLLLRRSLRKVDLCEVVGSVSDGQEAIDYLSGVNGYEDRERFPLPDVLLLDFQMPVKGGLEVLAWMREQQLPEIQTIVLSNSFAVGEVEKSLRMGARHCIERAEPDGDARMIEGFLRSMAIQGKEGTSIPRGYGGFASSRVSPRM